MASFSFIGKNGIYNDLINSLPDGTIYLKDNSVIPYMEKVIFIETFGSIADYPAGTNVEVYMNDILLDTRDIMNQGGNAYIYLPMTPKLGKFSMKTVINGTLFKEQYFYSINIFSFYVILARVMEYDEVELQKLFDNIYYNTLDNKEIYNKYGWFFDFIQNTLPIADYRRALIGDENQYLGTVRSFMNSITYYGLKELIKSFTTSEPDIYSYRDYRGCFLRDNSITQVWNLPKYWGSEDGETPITEDANNKNVILMDKTFKLNAIRINVKNWTYTNTEKAILESLIKSIIQNNIRVEILYNQSSIWNPIIP